MIIPRIEHSAFGLLCRITFFNVLIETMAAHDHM